MDNLGLTPNTYGRLVQIIDGRHDGFGNRLYIGASIGTSGDGSSGVNGANGSSGSLDQVVKMVLLVHLVQVVKMVVLVLHQMSSL
jgi:hypothetical protein